MSHKVKKADDFLAGSLFVVVGVGLIVVGQSYGLGTSSQMGSGYFPVWIGALLIALGVPLSLSSFAGSTRSLPRIVPRPALLVAASVAVFALLIDRAGFLPSTFLSSLLASAARPSFAWAKSVILAVIVTIGSWAVFIWALQVPFRPLGSWFSL